MRHGLVRTAAVAVAGAALWLSTAAPAQGGDTVITTRLPYVPAELLPPTELPSDPSSGVRVRLDPGDNEAPDPAPRVILTLRG